MYHFGVNARRRRLAATASVVCVVLVVVVAAWRPILRSAGWLLVANDPIEPADVIVVAIDAGSAGVLEAADLFHAGIAPLVAVFADPPDAVDREFLRRGIPYHDAAAIEVLQLHALGVTSVERIPRAVAGTEEEGSVLPEWCVERQMRSIVMVSHSDHTRRVRRVLRRVMDGREIRVSVRGSHYSEFDPDSWWQSRGAMRTEVVELQKLFLDLLRHPFS
jgi:hypothetical protein